MKAIHWFYIGAVIDAFALLFALGMVLSDINKGYSGTNNPTMYKAMLAMASLIGLAFLLKHYGKIGFANALLWIPGTLLVGYGLMMLVFIITKPNMR